jgi:hypothetical protein
MSNDWPGRNWKYVSPQPAGRVSRVQIEFASPHCPARPIEKGSHRAPGTVRSIASVGARQKPSFWLRTTCDFDDERSE